jgi:hypothetical protein
MGNVGARALVAWGLEPDALRRVPVVEDAMLP